MVSGQWFVTNRQSPETNLQSLVIVQQFCSRKPVFTLNSLPLLPVLALVALLAACTPKTSLATPAPHPAPAPFTPPSATPDEEFQLDAQASLRSLPAGETLAEQRELFRQGYRFYQEKKLSEARAFFQRALEVYPVLADYSLYYLGVISRDDAQTAEARAFFQRLLSEYPDSLWAGRVMLELAKLAVMESDWTEATRYAEQARAAKTSPVPIRQEALLIVAQAREQQGDTSDAYNLYQELRRIAPRSAVGKLAKERVEHLRAAAPDRFSLDTDGEYLDEIRLLYKEGEDAILDALVRQFNERFPASPLRSEALMLLANIYKNQGRVNEAVAVWKEVTERYAGSALAPIAMFNWAALLWNKDRDEEARVIFERLTQQYPRHEKAAEAWYALGRIWQERKEESRAVSAYDRLATLFAGSQLAREGRWRQGWMAYRRGDFRQAVRRFAALAKAFPDSPEGESACYWQARALERLDETEKAQRQYRALLRRYPDGYYAMLAEKRLQITPSPLPPGAERTGVLPSLPPRLADHYRRSQELLALRLPLLARQELDLVREGAPRDSASSEFLLSEYSRMDGYAAALRFAQELARDKDGNWWRYLYPQAYWSAVSAQAETRTLDPYLVLALMRQESLFDPEAVSPAQAYGLMQLLPKTAARVMHASAVSPSFLMDPDFNINAGAVYLRQLLDLYNGNTAMAIAAYNAGENAVEKWRARYADLELDEFVESISFRETRNYVKLVLRNYRTYQRLYGQTTPNEE